MIRIEFENQETVLGDTLRGKIAWTPEKDMTPRKINLVFGWHTEGRGSTAEDDVISCEHDCGAVVAGQTVEIPFKVTIPDDVPVSFDGELIRLIWSLKVRVDVPWAFDIKEDRAFRVLGPRVSV